MKSKMTKMITQIKKISSPAINNKKKIQIHKKVPQKDLQIYEELPPNEQSQ